MGGGGSILCGRKDTVDNEEHKGFQFGSLGTADSKLLGEQQPFRIKRASNRKHIFPLSVYFHGHPACFHGTPAPLGLAHTCCWPRPVTVWHSPPVK